MRRPVPDAYSATAIANPAQMFRPECGDCSFADLCADKVDASRNFLDASRAYERSFQELPLGMRTQPEVIAMRARAGQDIVDARADLTSTMVDAWYAAHCEGPDAYGRCDSPGLRELMRNHNRRQKAPRLRTVVALGLAAVISAAGIVANEYLHGGLSSETTAEAESPLARPDCLDGTLSGLAIGACEPMPSMPAFNNDPAPLKMPWFGPNSALDEPCVDINKYDYGEDPTPPVLIGYLNAPNSMKDKVSLLPADYQETLAAVTERPAVNYLLESTDVPIFVWYTDDSENGYFVSYSNDFARPRMDLCFGGTTALDRAFENQGSLESLLLHEGVHARHNGWDKIAAGPNGGRTKQLLSELSAACAADMEIVGEEFRKTQGPAVIEELTKLKQEFNKAGRRHISRAIDWTIARYKEENGLQGIVTAGTERGDDCTMLQVHEQIFIGLDELGLELGESDFEGVNVGSLRNANTALFQHFEQAMAHVNEGYVLPEVNSTATHPYDNIREYVASALASTQLNPSGVVDRINKLPANRRALEVEKLETLLEILELNDPKLVPHLYLPQVVATLRQPQAGTMQPIYSMEQIDQFVAEGRRGWVSLSPEQALAIATV